MSLSIRQKQWSWFLASVGIIVAVFFFLSILGFFSDAESTNQEISQKDNRLLVTVSEVVPANHSASIKVLAEVKSKSHSEIKAFVRGEIVGLSNGFSEGQHVSQGEVIIEIDDSIYQAQLAEAKNRLKMAKVRLLSEQRDAEYAQKNWQRSGITEKPKSLLTLHAPQVDAAKAELESAIKNLKAAEKQLAYTKIVAPFSGVITKKIVHLGERVEVGQPLFVLVDDKQLEIVVSLNSRHRELLAKKWQGQAAIISSISSNDHGTAVIERKSEIVDPETRQTQLYMSVTKKCATCEWLLPGMMVNVEMPGKQFNNVLKIPKTAVTADGYYWVVDNENRLRRIRSEYLLSENNSILTPAPDKYSVSSNNKWKVAIIPLTIFLDGTRVNTRLNKTPHFNRG